MPNGGNGPCVLQNKAIDRCHYVGSGGKLGPTRLREQFRRYGSTSSLA